MTKGLRCNIYKNSGGDCSNGGLSGSHDSVILTGLPSAAGVFEPSEDCPEVMLETVNLGYGYKAVPAKRPSGKVGPMFGGCFIYSSDSRFPFLSPIPLHDRWETPEEYEQMSR